MPLQDLSGRASFAIINAPRGEAINTSLPALRGPTWVRDRCRRVLCHACFHENDETYRFCQNCRCEAPRGCPPVENGANRLQVNETQLRTRYDQFRAFQRDKVGQRRKSTVADGFDKFMRSRSDRASGWEDASGVTPKQATPILRPDFQHLMRYMHTGLLCAAQPVDRLAYARDMALFAVAFRAGSRGSDLAKLLAAQVLHLPSSQGLVLNFHPTKTLRDGAAHASLLAPDNDMPETCAVAAMLRYAQAADSCGWDMSKVYLFPEIPASGDSTPKRLARPLSAKIMAARFKEHLGHAGLGLRQFTFH